MKHLFCFLIFYLFLTALLAQPTIQWQKTFGGNSYDEAKSIQQTNDGGYIVAGSTASNNGDVTEHFGGNDFWVIKLSGNGLVEWKKVLGGIGNEVPYSIQQTADGGYFVAGYTESDDHDVSGNHGGYYDGWVVKLSSTGEIEWQKALGGSGWDDIWSAKQTADNGFILTGRSSSSDGDATDNHGQLDVWVVKLDESGDIQWQKSFGGSKDDIGYAVKQTLDGGYIIAGETASTDGDVTDLHGNVDYWVIKLSSAGDLEWQKTLGGSHADIASDVIQTSDGGYAVLGYAGSNDGDMDEFHGLFDYWIVKLNNIGELQWQKALGGSELDYGRSIVPSGDGGYIIFGGTQSSNGDVVGNDGGADYWIVKVDSIGELVWQKTYGGSVAEVGFAINTTSDNGFILAGYAWSNDGDLAGSLNQGKDDFWIVKLGPESVGEHEAPNALAAPLEIFPNPTHQSISLKIPAEETIWNVTIADLLGREVLRQSNLNNDQMDVSALANGLYMLSAITTSGKVFQGKLEKI